MPDLVSIFAKIADKTKLDPGDKDELLRAAGDLQQAADTVLGWVGASASPPHFSQMFVDTPHFGTLPSDAVALVRKSNQSIPNATWTSISFDAQTFNAVLNFKTAGFWSSANPTRLTIPSGLGGIYLVFGRVEFVTNATGGRSVAIRRNASGTAGSFNNSKIALTPASWTTPVITLGLMSLNPTDYLELRVEQESGGALDATISTSLAAVRIH